MTSEYPLHGGLVCRYYDKRDKARLQNCVVYCVLCVTGCVMSDTCHTDNGTHEMAAAVKRLMASIPSANPTYLTLIHTPLTVFDQQRIVNFK